MQQVGWLAAIALTFASVACTTALPGPERHDVVTKHIATTTTTVTTDCGQPSSSSLPPRNEEPRPAYPINPNLPEHTGPQACIPRSISTTYYGVDSFSATLNIPELKFPAVNAYLAEEIVSVVCDGRSAIVQLGSKDAFDTAVEQWGSPFILKTWHETCGTGMNEEYDFLLVSSISQADPRSSSIVCEFEMIDLMEVVGGDGIVFIEWQAGLPPRQQPTCPRDFDKTLDAASPTHSLNPVNWLDALTMPPPHGERSAHLSPRIIPTANFVTDHESIPFSSYPNNSQYNGTPAYQMYQSSDLDVYCLGCGANSSSLQFQGSMYLELIPRPIKVLSSSATITGPIDATVNFAVDATSSMGATIAKLAMAHIPLPAYGISGIYTASIDLDLGVGGLVTVDKPGQLVAGTSLHWDNVYWMIDMKNPQNSVVGSLTPTLHPAFQSYDSIQATMDAYFEIDCRVIFNNSLTSGLYDVTLSEKPGVQVTAGLPGSSAFQGGFTSNYTGGPCLEAISADIYNNITVQNTASSPSLELFWKSNEYQQCDIPVPQSSTASPTTSTSTSSSIPSSTNMPSTSTSIATTSLSATTSTTSQTSSTSTSSVSSSLPTASTSTVTSPASTSTISTTTSTSTTSTSSTSTSQASVSSSVSSGLVSISSMTNSMASSSVAIIILSNSLSSSRTSSSDASKSAASITLTSSAVVTSLGTASASASSSIASSSMRSSSQASSLASSSVVSQSVGTPSIATSSSTSPSVTSASISGAGSSTIRLSSSAPLFTTSMMSGSGLSSSSVKSGTVIKSKTRKSHSRNATSNAIRSASSIGTTTTSKTSALASSSSLMSLRSSGAAPSSVVTVQSSSPSQSRSSAASAPPSTSKASRVSSRHRKSKAVSGTSRPTRQTSPASSASSTVLLSSMSTNNRSISSGMMMSSTISSRSASISSGSPSRTSTPSLSSVRSNNPASSASVSISSSRIAISSSTTPTRSSSVASSTSATVTTSSGVPSQIKASVGSASPASTRSTSFGSISSVTTSSSNLSLSSLTSQSSTFSTSCKSSAVKSTKPSTGSKSTTSTSITTIPASSTTSMICTPVTTTKALSTTTSTSIATLHTSSTTSTSCKSSSTITTSTTQLARPSVSHCSSIRVADSGDELQWSADGNIYISCPGNLPSHSTAFSYVEGSARLIFTGDYTNRSLHAYSDEISEYGVSRLRLHDLDAMPAKAELIAFAAIEHDGDHALAAYDSHGELYHTVVCRYSACGTEKVFLSKTAQGAEKLQNLQSITGSVGLQCRRVQLRGS